MAGFATTKQNAEFVTAQSSQSVVRPDVTIEDFGDLFKQFVTRDVTGGIVDNFELIKVQIKQHVVAPCFLGILECMGQSTFKFAPIGKVRQAVMVGHMLKG
jgi:hypothetical protein